MARSYAAIHQRIWADPEWRALDLGAQHLYLLLISQPQMNLAGVLPLQLRKWAGCVADWDVERVSAALKRLSADRFTVVDEDTEEVLVRSLIRNDEAYKTPGMLKSILKSAEHTQGPALRRELAIELGRLDPLEGKKADEGTALIAATRLALMPEGSPPDGGVIHSSDGIPDGIGEPIGDTFLGTHRGYLPKSSTEPIADTSVSVSVSVPSLSLVGNSERESAPPPPNEPPKCKRHAHLEAEDVPPCRPCGDLRELWETARTEAAKPKRARWCGECDERTRMVEVGRGMGRCPRCHPLVVAS